MNDVLPPWPLLPAFLFASLALAVTPGPGVLYIVTRSLIQGRRVGLASVAGVAFGNLGNALAASIGLAAVFAVSSLAFIVVKYAGALYLVYLGVHALLAPQVESCLPAPIPKSLARVFRDGFVVALLNPKTAIFFTAFLPQFLSSEAAPMVKSITLGCIFVAIAAVSDTGYALAAGAISPRLAQARGARVLGRYFTAGAFIGLGMLTAIGGSRNGK